MDAVNNLALIMNNVHPNISFTVEKETDDGKLPFLDVLIHREQDHLSFSWYHKVCWTGRFLNFHSFVPINWKRGLLRGFKYRIMRLCSPQYVTSAVEELSNVFRMNGYPESFIAHNFTQYIPHPKSKTFNTPKKPVSICLPFLGDERSDIWRFRIKKYVESTYPAARVIFYWKTTKSFHASVKDKVDKYDLHGVVYHFSCDCKQEYVGRTQLQLKERIKQHVPDWLVKGGKSRPRSTKPPDSAITRHLMSE